MLRATHVPTRVDYARATGLLLAGCALLTTAACGGPDTKDVSGGTPAVQSTGHVVTKADTGGNRVRVSDSVVQVSLKDGTAAYDEGRYSDAVRSFTVYVDRHPESTHGHYMLGLSAWKAGDLETATTSLERAVTLDSKNVKSRLNLARVLLDRGEPREARGQVSAALELDAGSSDAYRLLGRVRASLNQPNEAVAAYRIALSLDPDDAWSMNNLALILVQQQKYEEALPPLARAVQVDSSVPVFHNNLGIALEHLGRYTLATAAYQAAIGVDAGYTKAKLSLARVEGRKEDPALTPLALDSLALSFVSELRVAQVNRRGVRRDTIPQ